MPRRPHRSRSRLASSKSTSSTSSTTSTTALHKPSSSSSSSTTTNTNPSPSTDPPSTETLISIYDLLPPSRLSTLLWTLGSSLLHTGVHIPCLSHEYAYGGHSIPNLTGVYHTPPQTPPPASTFRQSLSMGLLLPSLLDGESGGGGEGREGGEGGEEGVRERVKAVVDATKKEFLGREYNLLERNCNHFTAALVERLTGRQVPRWVNRAAGLGGVMPCVVPREWISPPEATEGELEDGGGGGGGEDGERVGMLEGRNRSRKGRGRRKEEGGGESEVAMLVVPGGSEDGERDESVGRGRRISLEDQREWESKMDGLTDTAGREIPAAEKAPVL